MASFYAKSRRAAAVVVGCVFCISGLLKLMDPVGASFVVTEYFKFFHVAGLSFVSKGVAVALAFIEAVLGAALITGVWRKCIAIATFALTSVFTVITLILFIANPDMDCGCFGEAIHLTHLQTLLKNVILLALEAFAFIPFSGLGAPKKIKYGVFGIASASFAIFAIWSLLNIPLKDYTEFKPSAKLLAATTEEDFTDNATFPVLSIEGGEYDYLLTTGKVMVVSTEKDMSASRKISLRNFLSDASEAGFTTIHLTSDIEDYPDAYLSDYKTLLTLNRANGGVTYFDDGVLVRKWSARQYPSSFALEELYADDSSAVSLSYETKGGLTFQAFLLYVFAIMLLL